MATGLYERKLATLARVPLLIVDDFGLKPLRAPADEDLHDLISERYEQAAKARAKRGPTPVLARHMERISALPKPRQKLVMQVLESMLAPALALRARLRAKNSRRLNPEP